MKVLHTFKVSEKVYLVDTMALGQQSTVAAYLVKGRKVALVDCGYATSYTDVLEGLAEAGVSPSDIRYLIPTHVHLDHAGAAGHLIREMPNAEIIAHERAVPHLADPTRLIQSATLVFGAEIMKLYGEPLPVPSSRITATGEETHLDLGDGLSATLVYTPGHAPHQISIMLEGAGSMLTADAVGILYPEVRALIPTTPPPSFDPVALERSVRRLEQFEPETLLVPHFGEKRDVKFVFEETVRRVREWVEAVGRMRREGLGLDWITERMISEAKVRAGVDDLPIYAKVSVRTSVMGILHYLQKNA